MEAIATWRQDVSRSYYYVKGYASAKEFRNTQKALILAKQFHEGQYRKGGAKYLVHPLRVTCYLIALGLRDDILLSAALLHDVVEDVEEIRNEPYKLVSDYKLSEEVLNLVMLVTKNKDVSTESYYEGISNDWRALLIKLSDRCNNISTLQCFTLQKMKSYIEETKTYVLPLCEYAKLHFPEYSDIVTVMKYHITSICSLAESMIEKISSHNSVK